MVYFVRLMGHWTGKRWCFVKVQTHRTTFSMTFIWASYSFQAVQLSPYYTTTSFLLLQNVTMGSGVKTSLAFSWRHKIFKCLIIKFWKDFNRGWYVTANDTPLDLLCLVFLFSLLNQTLFISFWAKCLRNLLAWNHGFILSRCLSKSILL